MQVLPPISYPPILAPFADSVNLNSEVMRVYIDEVLPGMSSQGQTPNPLCCICEPVQAKT
jgi:chorismate mutase